MYKHQGYYRAEWIIDGKRYSRQTDIPATESKKNKEMAKKLQTRWRDEMLREQQAAEATRVRNPKGKILDQTLDEAFAEYWEEKAQFKKGAQDIKADITRILDYLGGDFMLSDIDNEVIIGMMQRRKKEFVKVRSKDGKPTIDKKTGLPKPQKLVSPRTVNITVGERMKWFLSYMAAKGRQVQPIRWESVWEDEQPRVTSFTYEHEELMIRTYRKDHLPALSFALLGGPRREQFIDLKWDQIDWDRRVITFRSLKKKPKKGQAPAPYVLPMTTGIENLILSQIDSETNQPYHPEYVWTYVAERTFINHKSGRFYEEGERYRLTYEGLGTEWARWKARHGIKDEVRMHDLRHAHGERMGEACCDPLIVRDSMNHGAVATTERYMGRVKIDRIRAAMEARDAMDAGRVGKSHTYIHTSGEADAKKSL
jgi:integrase